MFWFSLLRTLAGLSLSISKHMERRGYMQAGAAKVEKRLYKESLNRIHNAKEAYNNTPLDDDSLRADKSNRD